MTVYRRATATAMLAGVAPLVLTVLAASPVQAHGAPTDPLSRAVVCGPEGGRHARSAPCRAAAVENGGNSIADWDNVRVAGVGGRDRAAIPDGRLCSAGIDGFGGLDAARADWPATSLTAGADLTLTYRSTIAHRGTFEVYLTNAEYDPSRALTWDDLDPKPVAKVVDPQLAKGAYRIRGTLPTDRTGRHILYTIWRNSDTPDTYYSCSDVRLTAPGPVESPDSPGGEDSGAAASPGGAADGPPDGDGGSDAEGGTADGGSEAADEAAGTASPPEADGPRDTAGASASEPGAADPQDRPPSGPAASGAVATGSSSDSQPSTLLLGGAAMLAVGAAVAASVLRRRRLT